jgi:hypothetical protein
VLFKKKEAERELAAKTVSIYKLCRQNKSKQGKKGREKHWSARANEKRR